MILNRFHSLNSIYSAKINAITLIDLSKTIISSLSQQYNQQSSCHFTFHAHFLMIAMLCEAEIEKKMKDLYANVI